MTVQSIHYVGPKRMRFPRPYRFPRLADPTELERLEQTVSKFLPEALLLRSKYKKMRLVMGHTFLRMKAIVGHDHWQDYFRKKWEPKGISLRTAQNWMRYASTGKVYVPPEKRKVSFSPATDPEAVERDKDVEKARAVDARSFQPPPVLLESVQEREETKELWRLHRDEVEKRTIELWRQLRHELFTRKERAA